MAGVLAGITTVMTGMCAKLFVGRSINIFYRKGIFFDAVKSTATSSCTTSDKTARMTGLSKQYLSIKNKYPEFIVLFQVGDFYEIYSGDAVKVAEKTSLRISRNPNVNKLMAGFPVRSLDSWLSTLVQQGFQLAICPQFPEKTPSTSKLLHREVVRLVTPGTLLDPLKPDANYLMSIACGPDCSLGLAWLDLSTGEFHHGLSLLENLEEDLSRINPAEILMAEEHLTSLGTKHNHKTGINIKKSSLENVRDYHLTIVPSDWFTVDSSHQDGALARLLKSVNFSQFSSLEMAAGYSLLKFVSYTQRDIAPLLNQPSKFSLQTHMAIDSNTRRALELTKSLVGTDSKATLFGVMNNTATASGQRLLYSRLCAPSNDVDVVQKRLNVVDFFCMNRHLAEDIQKALKSCPDVERKMQKVATGAASLSDLHAIYSAIALYKYILLLLHDTYFNVNLQAIEELLMKDFSLLDDLYRELDTAVGKVESDHTVMKGYSNKADEIKEKLCKNMKQVDKLRDVYRVSLKIPRLTISNHKSFIRVVEIPLSQKNSLGWNQDFVFLESTKDKARYITLKLQELNAKWKALQEENEIIQRALSDDLCNQVTSHAESLKKLAVALAELDVSSSLAVLAVKRGYVKPIIGNQNEFLVKGGRHPVVDMLQPNSFVCNDCDLGKKNLWIITGPNMGGKSTFLRQNALIAILAQAGSFVPAQTAKIGVIDRLFARIGATDNLVQHQSTFMSEMLETAFILAQATEKSLVVVDEIGRGTSVLDGVSIAWAVIEHLHSSIRCRTLASTHYHQLGKLAHILPHVDCYHVTALHSKDRLSFTYKVNHGCDQKSFGIDVAKLAGVPITVEARAREILQVLEDKGNSLEVTLEEDKLVSESWKTQKGKESSNTSPFITTNDLQAENEITRVLLELNPELLTPKDALEIIYDLHLKAQCKSSRKNY